MLRSGTASATTPASCSSLARQKSASRTVARSVRNASASVVVRAVNRGNGCAPSHRSSACGSSAASSTRPVDVACAGSRAPQVQPVGAQQGARLGLGRGLEEAAARDDHDLAFVEHDRREPFAGLGREPVQGRLQQPWQARRCEVAARKAQHAGRQPIVAAVGFEVAQVRQRQKLAPRRSAAEPGSARCQRDIQPLPFGVETLEHCQTLGQPLDEICFGNRHRLAVYRPRCDRPAQPCANLAQPRAPHVRLSPERQRRAVRLRIFAA